MDYDNYEIDDIGMITIFLKGNFVTNTAIGGLLKEAGYKYVGTI